MVTVPSRFAPAISLSARSGPASSAISAVVDGATCADADEAGHAASELASSRRVPPNLIGAAHLLQNTMGVPPGITRQYETPLGAATSSAGLADENFLVELRPLVPLVEKFRQVDECHVQAGG